MNAAVPGDCIDRLRVCAPAAQTDAVRAALERASWPRAGRGEWLFIRKVAVRSPAAWLGPRAAAAASCLASAAQPGRPGALSGADAVRFRSLSELLACLSIDLAAGRAAGCWYWRRWSRLFGLRRGDALTQLWQEQVDYLPAVVAAVAAYGSLAALWQRLEPADAARLCAAIARARRLPGSAVPLAASRPAPLTAPPPRQRGRWQAALSGIDAADERAVLAALLTCLEWRPVLLLEAPWQRVAAVARALTDTPDRRQAAAPAAVHVHGERPSAASGDGARRAADAARPETAPPILIAPTDAPSHTPGSQNSGTAAGQAAAGNGGRDLAAAAGRRPPARRTVTHDRPVSPGASPRRPTLALRRGPGAPQTAADVDEPASGAQRGARELLTREGGLFYLVNLLSHPAIVARLAAENAFRESPDGWSWLLALGLALGIDPPGSLARFLGREAEQAGDDARPPPAAAVADILDEGRRLYRSLAPADGLLDSELLDVPAFVTLTESHLDVFMPFSAVRLAVRLAGLDVNPGWVAWLGRVVTFHYVDDASPLLGGAA